MEIREKIKRLCYSPYCPVIVFMLAVFVMIFRVQILPNNDDSWLKAAIENEGVFNWIVSRYFNWSGSISIELFIGLIQYNMLLWKVLNTVMSGIFILVLSKYVISDEDQVQIRRYIYIFLCCSVFLLCPYELTSAVAWCTGSFRYLWTGTAMLCALLPFYNEIVGKKTKYKITYWAYFISSFYAAYFRQTGIILVCFGLITLSILVLKKKKIKRVLFIQYLFIVGNFIISLLAPGEKIRFIQEMQWYPNYENISLVQRIFEAVSWTNMHVLLTSSLLTLILLSLILYICIKKYRSKIITFFVSIPWVFILLKMTFFNRIFTFVNNDNNAAVLDVKEKINGLFYNPMQYLNDETSKFVSLFPAMVCIFLVLFIGVLITLCFEKSREKFAFTLLYFLALGSGYVLFMRPTLYVEGRAVFFTGDCLILVTIGALIKQILNRIDSSKQKMFRWIKYGVVLGTIAMFGMYLVRYVNSPCSL